MKTWYTSKTLWLNIIAGLALLLQSRYGFIIDPEAQAGILAVINLVLRAVTGQPIEWKAPTPPDAGFIRLPLMAVLLMVCLALGSLAGCSTIRHATTTDTPETILTAQDRAQQVVMGFQAAFAVTPEIVDALLANGTITPHIYNAEILPAYNRGLASLAVVVSALQSAQDARQDPNQTHAYTVALARFLTDKAAIDNMLVAFGGGAK